MTEKKIQELLTRYEQMLVSGKPVYFDADEFFELATHYEKLEDLEFAKNIIDQGLLIHPQNEQLMTKKARFLIYDLRFSEALCFLKTHLDLEDSEILLMKIECLLNLDFFAEASEITMKLLQAEDVGLAEILSELGFIYLECEYLDEAILYLSKSYELDPSNVEVIDDLVYAYEANGDFDSAILFNNLALDIDPHSLELWLNLSKLYSLKGAYVDAIEAIDFALALDDGNVVALKFKAHCLILSKQYSDAIDILETLLLVYIDDESLYSALYDAYLSSDKYIEMHSVVDRYELNVGHSLFSQIKRAYTYMLQSDLLLASQIVNNLLLQETESSELFVLAGELYYKLNDVEKSCLNYQKAYDLLDEENDDVLHKIVSLKVELGCVADAIVYQQKFIEKYNDYESLSKLALLYLELGDESGFLNTIDLFDLKQVQEFYSLFYPLHNNITEVEDQAEEFYKRRLHEVFLMKIIS